MISAALAVGTGGVAAASCSPKAEVRATAEAFLHALARGDGKAACRLLSPAAMDDGGYRTMRACVRAHRHLRFLGRFRVVRVRLQSDGTALAIVNDSAISDSGNDALVLGRHHRRWLIDNE